MLASTLCIVRHALKRIRNWRGEGFEDEGCGFVVQVGVVVGGSETWLWLCGIGVEISTSRIFSRRQNKPHRESCDKQRMTH